MSNLIKRMLQIPKTRLIKKLLGYDEIYTIGIRFRSSDSLLDGKNKIFYPIPYSDEFWYADPIAWEHNGKTYLFAEAYDRHKHKGHIVVAEIQDDIRDIQFKKIIDEPYHMSFPMIFSWENDIYMLPETSENYSLNIYKAEQFPLLWRKVAEIKTDKMLVDSVLMKNTSKGIVLLSSEICQDNPLYVKFCYNLLDMKKHAILPIENQQERGYNLQDRAAGVPFEYKNKYILPTQTSTECDYGVKIAFCYLLDTEFNIYQEFTVDDVSVAGINCKDMIGIHTYGQTSKVEFIDLRYLKFSPVNQYKKIIQK